MKKLDWYLLRQILSTFVFAILILAVVTAVIDFSEHVDNFFERKAPTSDILKYYRNFLPFMIAFLLPLFIFISTIFATSRLAYRSEIIAILASGVSFARLTRAYFVAAALLFALSMWVNHWVVPKGNHTRLMLEDKYFHNKQYSSQRNVHLRLSKDLFVYLQSYDYVSNYGYRFSAEQIKEGRVKEKLFADRCSYDSVRGTWTLYNVVIRKNEGLAESLEMIPVMEKKYAGFSPKDLDEDNDNMQAFTTPELIRIIEREKLRGRESLNYFYIERYRRTAQPFAGVILVVIGVSIASRKVRGGSGLHLALGIVLSAIYILAMQFTTTFSTKAGMNPLLAVWIPNLLFGVIAAWLYRRQLV